MSEKPSPRHLRDIQAVLDALPNNEDLDLMRGTARNVVVLEDALFALQAGMMCGLSMQQIRENARVATDAR